MMERKQWNMVLSLLVVVVIGGLLLGVAHQWSKGPIAQAREAALHHMLVQVLPQHDNVPARETVELDGRTVFVARLHGVLQGFSWSVVAPDGYQGKIEILLGLQDDGALHAIRIIAHNETPGLGDGIVRNQSWLDQFVGQRLDSIHWAVRKDGGDFDQFTGATITPRAVVAAVKRGLLWFHVHRQQLQQLVASPTVRGE